MEEADGWTRNLLECALINMNKVKLLVACLIFINILLFIVVYLNRGDKDVISPTPEPTFSKGLTVVSTYPLLDSMLQVSSGTPIVIGFDSSLDPSSIVIQTNPFVETNISVSGETVIIKSKTYWPTDQEIKITLTARGVSGTQMNNPYEFVIKSPQPTF